MERRFYKGLHRYKKGDWCIGFTIDKDSKWSGTFHVALDLLKIRLYFGIDNTADDEDILY